MLSPSESANIIIAILYRSKGMISEQESSDEEIRKLHEKWKKWKMELQLNKLGFKKGEVQKPIIIPVGKAEQNTKEYVRKLIEKMEQPETQICPINKNLADEMETNTCTICFELMAPPNVPYILFPCGHNICKICLFTHPNSKQQKPTLKLSKCPLCRMQITNQAQNRNLMKLIYSYINKKQLIQKQQQSQKQRPQTDNIMKLTQHCQLLNGEKRVLTQELQDLKKGKKVLEEVIQRLLDQRRKCRREIDALEDQSRLINKHVNEKQQQMDRIQTKIAELQQKQQSIQSTLTPLKSQKESLELKEASRLIQNK